jgi:hypothetical protein
MNTDNCLDCNILHGRSAVCSAMAIFFNSSILRFLILINPFKIMVKDRHKNHGQVWNWIKSCIFAPKFDKNELIRTIF